MPCTNPDRRHMVRHWNSDLSGQGSLISDVIPRNVTHVLWDSLSPGSLAVLELNRLNRLTSQ